ncbi:hypothetical protein S245_014845, partial [Arachis hypogaea]
MKPPQTSSAHVLIFPCPAQGHVNSMLNLAQLLALRNLHVTFLNTEHIHNRLTRFADIESLPARYHTLRFKTIPDGLPEEHPRSGERSVEPLHSVKVHGKPLLRDILVKEKVTCLVADGFFGKLANDLAEEIGVPIIHFRTIGASCFWTYFWIPYLFDSNELPVTAQGHVNSMLNLAQLLAVRNLHVTFLNTEHIHNRLTRFAHIESLAARYPTLRFKSIPDGLPEEHPRSGEQAMEPLHSVKVHGKPLLRDILVKEKVTCLVADGFFGKLANDMAEEVGVASIHFRTIGASSFWTYFWIPYLFHSNELPITGEEDMDRIISTIPGMENLLRCRDLPSFCRPNRAKGEPIIPLETIVSETHQTLRARAVIFNTFDDLESPALFHLRLRFPTIFTVGPLHLHRACRAPTATNTKTSNNSMREEDTSCMAWLDSQPLRSVIYVSFGSITTMTRESLLEFWYGLVNSKMRFLWVVRSDIIAGGEGKDES